MSVCGHSLTSSKHEIVSSRVDSVHAYTKRLTSLKMKLKCRAFRRCDFEMSYLYSTEAYM